MRCIPARSVSLVFDKKCPLAKFSTLKCANVGEGFETLEHDSFTLEFL